MYAVFAEPRGGGGGWRVAKFTNHHEGATVQQLTEREGMLVNTTAKKKKTPGAQSLLLNNVD